MTSFMAERILVTGAAGFIGSNLVETLLKAGKLVTGVDNFDPFYSRTIKEHNIENALKDPGYHFEEGDIRDTGFINNCFKTFQPDIIVHLAARAGVRPSLIDPRGYYDVNVMGTLNLLEEMRNIDVFCLRFFTVYGKRQRPDLAIHKFTRALLKDGFISLYGDGSSRRDYTHIDDIIQGLMGAIRELKGFEIFNLGESATISLINLVSVLEKYTNKKARIKYLPMQKGDVIQTFADISKARDKLNYNPVMDIETGIKMYVKDFITSDVLQD
ncbi:MAG: NAD-dependent epimerase/dehydratase [Bacteroidetes bacterium]|nr:NAD-dependent epimerase/dehydratase [Bacteroidota bacterium]